MTIKIRNKGQIALTFLGIVGLVLAPLATAAPSFNSYDHKTFDQHQGTEQLYDITVTEDAGQPVIKAGYLEISIPSELPIIFDDERTKSEMVLYGNAVEEGKISERPEITFTDKDTSLQIPILKDLEAGDTFVITRIFVEGFYSQPQVSAPLKFSINGEESIYFDSKHLYVRTSSYTDSHVPEAPSQLMAKNTKEGVVLNWEDPSDQDIQFLEIYRGTSADEGINAPIGYIKPGEETFLDTEVETGKKFYYRVRATDGRNNSDLSNEVSTTVTHSDESENQEETDENDDNTTENTNDSTDDVSDDESSDDGETQPEDTTEISFEDIADHWASAAIRDLAERKVIFGQTETKFNPNGLLNRAEAAALMYRIFNAEGNLEAEGGHFTDVTSSDWFYTYVNALQEAEIVTGNPDGSYRPSNNINRSEFIVLAMRLYEKLNGAPANQDTMSQFDDIPAGAWYAEIVLRARAKGIVEGETCTVGQCFNPGRSITRAEATTILKRLFF